MAEIEEEEYIETASRLIQNKWDTLSGPALQKREKTKRFMAGKGYEFELINSILKSFT